MTTEATETGQGSDQDTDQAPPTTFAEAELVLAQTLPGYEARPEQQRMALAVEQAIADTGSQAMVEAGCGCIQGDAEIIVNRGGNAKRYPLREVVAKFNGESVQGKPGGVAQRSYAWNRDIPTYVQREAEDGTVRLALLVNAWHSGVKQTYTVTTDTGRTIRATDEHPFLTERGWLRLDELVVGDLVHVRGTQRAGGRTKKITYARVFGMRHHPYANVWNYASRASKHMVPQHRLVAEAGRNGLSYETFLRRVTVGDVAGLEFIDPQVFAVHHKDHDSKNNDPSNLSVMTHREHHQLHADEGKTSQVLYKVATESVVSVEPYGMEETYDLEVADDPHNFIANGFVVHNTGKSLGAMIPAILSGKRTVVATATKALMDQYAAKDIPFLQEHLGVPFTWALLKGRSNYACEAKMSDPQKVDPALVQAMVAEMAAFEQETGQRHSGDMDDFTTVTFTGSDRAGLTMSAMNCPGARDCPFGETCYSQAAKRKAAESSLVITNTAMLMTDVKVRKATDGLVSMLGDWDTLIVDEAHELGEIATNCLEEQTTQAAIERLLNDVSGFFGAQGSSVKSEVASGLIDAAVDVWSDLPVPQKAGESLRIGLSYFAEHFEPYVALIDALRSLMHEVSALTLAEDTRKEISRRNNLRARIRNMIALYTDLATSDGEQIVRWVKMEQLGNGRFRDTVKVLCSAPIDVAPILTDWLWERPSRREQPTSVLVSATMSVGGDFSFLQDSLGLQQAVCTNVGTPFDYDSQALLFVPGPKLPNPKDRFSWLTYSQTATMELITAAGGGALLLFTSRSSMEASYEALRPRIESAGYSTLMQGLSGSNKVIAQAFKDDEHSVLFALKSFFTGVDIPGNALRLVVIDKLPFGVPTEPISMARSDLVESRGKSSFRDLAIPQMTLTLVQGYGRLIRTKSDKGVVAILDSRLSSTAWGRKIVQSFPDSPATTELDDVYAFYRQG